jgi:dephospho-CoA kinase
MKVISIVGMAGAGKSEAARFFTEHGFYRIRFGDVTDEEIRKRGLELNEANERFVREQLRQELGMAAYAKLNLPRIDAASSRSPVVIDGLYSWEEYCLLKEHYGAAFLVVAIVSAPSVRYVRLAHRIVRPLTAAEAATRDHSEIEKLNKGGPIAMADVTVVNDSTLDDLQGQLEKVIVRLTI